MVKPKYLYHGSGRNLIGNKLVPKQARDLDRKNINNNQRGIYAASVKEQAIAMGLHSCKGVKEGSLQMYKTGGKIKIRESIIYEGWPRQKYCYLYTLSSKTFQNRPRGSSQWVSLVTVKPSKIEKLLVKDYTKLIRKPTKKEKREWEDLKKKLKK